MNLNLVGIDLTLMESLRVMVTISFHSRTIGTSHQNLLGHSVPARVSSEDAFMHVFHDLFLFFLVHTTEQSRIMVVLVQNPIA